MTASAAATSSTSSPTISRSRTEASARSDELRNTLDDLANRHLLRLFRRAGLQLDASLLQRTWADRHPRGDPNQIGVLELDAGSLVAVVEQRIDPVLLELGTDALGGLPQGRVAGVHRNHVGTERCQRCRPHDAGGVVVLLDGGRHGASDADAV